MAIPTSLFELDEKVQVIIEIPELNFFVETTIVTEVAYYETLQYTGWGYMVTDMPEVPNPHFKLKEEWLRKKPKPSEFDSWELLKNSLEDPIVA